MLVALLPIIGTTGQFSADEGAALAQARQLQRGDGWTVPDSFPQADPDGSAFPFELSTRGRDGYAPFSKHPVYPVMLAAADRVLGDAGGFLLSIAGTVAAAMMSALLARRLDAGLAIPALWVTGLASPLLFDSYLVVAHTIGAAFAGLAVICAARALGRPTRGWPLAVVGVVALGTMLRTEMLIFGIALTVALVVTRRARTTSWVLVAAPVAGALLGWVLDRELGRLAVPGPRSETRWLEKPSQGLLSARFSAFKITWLLPSYDVTPMSGLLVGAIVSAAIAVWLARARPDERDGVRVFAGVALVAALAWLVVADGAVPGLLLALPILVIGVVAWDRRPVPSPSHLLTTTFVVFSIGVLATQYASGGSGEWGGRYFAIALPVVIPVVLFTTVQVWRRLDRRTAMLAVASVGVLSLALGVRAVLVLRESHRDVDALVAAIHSSARANPSADGGLPVVLTTNGAAGRFAFTVVERTRWLTVPSDRLDEYRDRLRSLGVTSITFVTTDKDDLRRVSDVYRDAGELHPVAGWIVSSMHLP